jgi:hypothetical protein
LLAALSAATPAWAHTVDCSGRTGLELARCERHQKMAAKCGPLQGEAHAACDRDFLIANPLDCSGRQGDELKRCAAETAAFKTCAPKQGHSFMACVAETAKASPMGQ